MIPSEVMKHLEEIEEETIHKIIKNTPSDNFKTLLVMGESFRKANLEPIYLMSPDQCHFTVCCEETRDSKKLH